jgi:hypothetical protein
MKSKATSGSGRKTTAGAGSKETAKLKLGKLSGKDALADRLVEAGVLSLRRIAATPAQALLGQFDGKLTRADQEALRTTQRNARRMATYSSERALMVNVDAGMNGMWPVAPDKVPPRVEFCGCACCDNIFSLKAYLFDLLDLLAEHWDIGMIDVERIQQRSFSQHRIFESRRGVGAKAKLHCEELNAPLPHARIAAEVLEEHLGGLGIALPTGNAAWKTGFEDRLLRLIVPRETQLAALGSQPRNTPLTIAMVEAAPNLTAVTSTAVSNWKSKLNTLVLSLDGLLEAEALLSDYSLSYTGFAPNTLLASLPEDADEQMRSARESTLRFEAARDLTVRQWFADYRKTLVAASGRNHEVLEAGLFISLSFSPARTTTRLQEFVVSLQQIVENIRSGEIASFNRADIGSALNDRLRAAVTQPLAEGAWLRLRDYETWLGFMYGWVYPENVINPLALELIRPDEDNTPLKIRLHYLDLAGGLPEIYGPLSNYEAHERDAETRRLRLWKADVDIDRRNHPASGLTQIEADLLFPLAAGRVLNQLEFFSEAHDWFSLLIHPVKRTTAHIFTTVVELTTAADGLTYSTGSWFDDAFEPAAVANRRPGVWLRHTLLAMVGNLIDWADDDFARGLPDSIQRAEERYEFACKLLGADQLNDSCEQVVLTIRTAIEDGLKLKKGKFAGHYRSLSNIQSRKVLEQAASDVRKVIQGRGSLKQKEAAVRRTIEAAAAMDRKEHPSHTLAEDWKTGRDRSLAFEDDVFFKPDPNDPFPPPGDGPFPHGPDGKPDFPGRDDPRDVVPDKGQFDDDLDFPEPPGPPTTISLGFCVPLNPAVLLLRKRIHAQLDKLARSLDFLGEPQQPRVYDCTTYDVSTGLINRPAAVAQFDYAVEQPRYRYSFLIEKARQYVDTAQRIGALLLQAVQNKENEAFQQLKAKHAIELAGATVELKRLGQIEAGHGVDIAELQAARADSQVTFWETRAGGDIDSAYDSLSADEKAALYHAEQSANWHTAAAVSTGISAAPAVLLGAIGAASGATAAVTAASGVGIPVSIGAATVALASLGGAAALGQSISAFSGSMAARDSALSNQFQMQAANERRFEDWTNQLDLARFDAQIAELQTTLANDRVAMADQDMEIAELQLAHAREELRFLQNKLTNVAMYDWMVRVLSRDYRALMQIAAGVARMAQRALEFERQEPVRIIVGDYWNVAAGVLGSEELTDAQRSLGLLGAERLLTDLTKLDAFKLATERRRQQISKTISLARMMPIEVVGFRRDGTITFNTLMSWFDDDFPGHYLRLIKSVKVTVLAITPPIDGIHAQLHNSGESSVVVRQPDTLEFVKQRALRNFGERISLDAPFNESGLFVFNYEDPMLLPFEGLGVETQWTLALPRGNNRFNFDSIADVLLTIEYTAEHDAVYEGRQKDAQAAVVVHDDTAIPLRVQFPDLWYHFKNHLPPAAGAATPFQFKFHLPRAAFAPNLGAIRVAHLTLLISGDLTAALQGEIADGMTITHSATSTELHKGKVPRPAVVGSTPATTGDGTSAFGHPLFGPDSVLLSSRGNSANGLHDHPLIAIAPVDEWSITFDPTLFPAVAGKVSDILLVITVSGQRELPPV